MFAAAAGHGEEAGRGEVPPPAAGRPAPPLPAPLRRTAPFLTHPVFHRHRSELQMMRYLRRLERRDLGLDRSMIPLGSCTMKLNAAAELRPFTWPEFGRLHPFVPPAQAGGYRQVIDELEAALRAVTGFDAVSLQPNSGAQGELAGLLVIRAYHRDRGAPGRDVVLIPASAHGTNPASAVMAGMRVVVVACAENGDVDVADLRAKARAHGDGLAALMVTYPSTHGVFEDVIAEICAVVHECGGQVYMDGANMNAQVGLTSPARIGADVCHLNLHKTFAIPHGGGGPGMGPIAVAAHLAPYLPGHPLVPAPGRAGHPAGGGGSLGQREHPAHRARLHAAPGRPRDDGGDGGRHPERELREGAPRGPLRRPLRPRQRPGGARADLRPAPVAGGARDHGRGRGQAPDGLRLPRPDGLVPGPRDADGRADGERGARRAGPLLRRHAADPGRDRGRGRRPRGRAGQRAEGRPAHCARDRGRRLGPRLQRCAAAYPLPFVEDDKFWPPVGRIDNAHGDRNLVCSCPPVAEYAGDD